jgi:hypothetical protein
MRPEEKRWIAACDLFERIRARLVADVGEDRASVLSETYSVSGSRWWKPFNRACDLKHRALLTVCA